MGKDNELLAINELKSIDLAHLTTEIINSDDFNQKYDMLLSVLDRLNTLKTDINESIKSTLKEQYMKTGEGKLSTDKFVYSYIPGSTKTMIDTTKLKAEDPDTYKKYVKISTVKESVRVNRVAEDKTE